MKKCHGKKSRNQCGIIKRPRLNAAGISSDRPSGPERLCQCALVEIIEFAADRQTMSELRQANRILIDPFSNVMGCRLPLQRRVHGQYHLVNAATRNPPDQPVDVKILRSYFFMRRQTSAQHQEKPPK